MGEQSFVPWWFHVVAGLLAALCKFSNAVQATPESKPQQRHPHEINSSIAKDYPIAHPPNPGSQHT
jgi:hypothetical protein